MRVVHESGQLLRWPYVVNYGKERDSEDEFRGADFRDENTKLLFAYDYTNRFVIRVWGHNYKPLLRDECKRLGVRIFDRVAVSALLTEGGRPGARVAGAMGVHCRSGASVVVRTKATVLATNRPQRIWTFSSELRGISTFRPPSCSGTGYAIAWRAGAEFTMMEKSMRSPFASPYSFPPYGSGNGINTWYPCTIVDANGKEVPWVDAYGGPLASVAVRSRARNSFSWGEVRARIPTRGCRSTWGRSRFPTWKRVCSQANSLRRSTPISPACRRWSAARSGASWSATKARRAFR